MRFRNPFSSWNSFLIHLTKGDQIMSMTVIPIKFAPVDDGDKPRTSNLPVFIETSTLEKNGVVRYSFRNDSNAPSFRVSMTDFIELMKEAEVDADLKQNGDWSRDVSLQDLLDIQAPEG
tara:strand:- start:338 stop:694 length:357 start_codon:yes stop_codon:yes gene_type:complete